MSIDWKVDEKQQMVILHVGLWEVYQYATFGLMREIIRLMDMKVRPPKLFSVCCKGERFSSLKYILIHPFN